MGHDNICNNFHQVGNKLNFYNNNLISYDLKDLKEDFDKYNKEYLYELNRLRLEKDKLNINEKDNLDLKWIKRIYRLQ